MVKCTLVDLPLHLLRRQMTRVRLSLLVVTCETDKIEVISTTIKITKKNLQKLVLKTTIAIIIGVTNSIATLITTIFIDIKITKKYITDRENIKQTNNIQLRISQQTNWITKQILSKSRKNNKKLLFDPKLQIFYLHCRLFHLYPHRVHRYHIHPFIQAFIRTNSLIWKQKLIRKKMSSCKSCHNHNNKNNENNNNNSSNKRG